MFTQLKEPRHDKTNKMACATSENSDLPGHPPSLIRVFAVPARRKLWSHLAIYWAHSEDSDQTRRMPRLIWVFAGRTVILWFLSWGGSKYKAIRTAVLNFGQWDTKFSSSLNSAFRLVDLFRSVLTHYTTFCPTNKTKCTLLSHNGQILKWGSIIIEINFSKAAYETKVTN